MFLFSQTQLSFRRGDSGPSTGEVPVRMPRARSSFVWPHSPRPKTISGTLHVLPQPSLCFPPEAVCPSLHSSRARAAGTGCVAQKGCARADGGRLALGCRVRQSRETIYTSPNRFVYAPYVRHCEHVLVVDTCVVHTCLVCRTAQTERRRCDRGHFLCYRGCRHFEMTALHFC